MFEAARFGDEVSHSNALLGFLRGRCGTGAGCCRVGIHYIHRWVRRMPAGRCAVGRGGILGGMMANIGESIGGGMSSPMGAIRSVARNVYINSRLAAEVQAKGLGSNLGNIKVSKKPLLEDVQKEKVSPEVYDKLRKRTPSTAIRKMVNKDVSLPMKDPALPGMEITKSLYADHIQSMKSITEMDGFAKLRFEDQVAVLNHEPNFVGLSEVANTSKGAQSFNEWTGYKKGNIAVDPAFKAGMIERSDALKPEIQQLIYDKLSKY